MPRINLCFLWHMHQPFYKDLISGEYKLPWTRMHALKDYYGMVRILEEFPNIKQTFNLVPSMMVQIEEYANGEARDPFLQAALKPAEDLTEADQQFILRHFFNANPGRMIYRYPRYGELYDAWKAQRESGSTRGMFGIQEFRDLQVLSQLAWFDEYYQDDDTETIALLTKGRDFSLEDQAAMGRKQRELVGLVIPEYKKLALAGQIEISTTPFYHPILPLLCDSDVASIAHPNVPLPRRFKYPEDARKQLVMARDYIGRVFGVMPIGLWPSEGSVSDEALGLAADVGFQWSATDNGVLDRTLGHSAGVSGTYQPWVWEHDKREMKLIFRDHLMSDLIGFVYSGMPAQDAAGDFVNRIRDNCRGILQSGRDAMVPIILDGENAWEYYERGGRPFFRELYSLISNDASMRAITVNEAFQQMTPAKLDHIFPGSWINANFDVWIGAEEDNRAWEFVLAAREAYDNSTSATAEQRALAYEELLIAEGSDWNWWYGPEHDSANREEFDQLFRAHIANVYRALSLVPPQELSRPILLVQVEETQTAPTGPVHATIDGLVTSYFEWLGAGVYRVDSRSGSMHGKRVVVKDLYYGGDGKNLFVRFDFQEEAKDLLAAGLDIRFRVKNRSGVWESNGSLHIESGAASVSSNVASDLTNFDCAFHQVLELAIPVQDQAVQFQASIWQDGLPLEALPPQGWLTVDTGDTDWAV